MKTYEVTFSKKYVVNLLDDSTEVDALEQAEAIMEVEIDNGRFFPLDDKVFPLN